jgi:hypothetical protein
MAHPTRFPHLALPFAIVGAAGGWLSTELLANPLMRMTWPGKEWVAALIAMALAGATGALLTRWCAGKRYAYELEAPDPDDRLSTDTWLRHVTAVLLAGTLTGLAVALLFETYRGPVIGALSGLCCAIAFVPVCALVIVTARRAQRARLGSIVSGSDRRAVWGILATALAVTTVEAAPDWPAYLAGERAAPLPAVLLVVGAGAVITFVMAADARALRLARSSTAQGLTQRDAADPEPAGEGLAKVDLGLGEGSWERLARSASAYRGRDRTLALIQGDPEQALSALRRALGRGAIGLAVTVAVCAVHAAAASPPVQQIYAERRCEMEDFAACTRAADHLRTAHLSKAVELYRAACGGSDASACSTLAGMYERGEVEDVVLSYPPDEQGRVKKEAASVHYHRRACDTGVVASCRHGLSRRDQTVYRYRPWAPHLM